MRVCDYDKSVSIDSRLLSVATMGLGEEIEQAAVVGFQGIEIDENGRGVYLEDADTVGLSVDDFAGGMGAEKIRAHGRGDDYGVAEGGVVAGHYDLLGGGAGVEGLG